MTLRIINGQQVQALLPMDTCIDLMASAMLAASTGTVAMPPRSIGPLIDNSGYFGLMPGSSKVLGSYGAKLISLHSDNSGKGLPTIQGFVCLFDFDSGCPVAIIDAATITAIRTAAASGLATRILACADAESCGIFGTGVQAVSHIDAMQAVRPLKYILLWGRDADKTRAFARVQAERTGTDIRASSKPQEVAACDLVCTVTSSAEPVLKGAWVKTGAHVNLVGAHTLTSREADTDLIRKSMLYVDLMAACRREGGDFMIPIEEGAIAEEHILGEIGQLLSGDIVGRSDPAQITVYNSLGMVAQDLYAARYVFDKAVASGVGVSVDL